MPYRNIILFFSILTLGANLYAEEQRTAPADIPVIDRAATGSAIQATTDTGRQKSATKTDAVQQTEPTETYAEDEPLDQYEYENDETTAGQHGRPKPRQGSKLLFVPGSSAPPARQKRELLHEAGEIIIFSKDMPAAKQLAEQLAASGYGVKRRKVFKNLGFVINVIRLPPGMHVSQALASIRQQTPDMIVDANHRYQPSGRPSIWQMHDMIAWGKPGMTCGKGIRLGLIDTGIDTSHQSLAPHQVTSRSMLPMGVEAAAPQHGTAIASLLIGLPSSGIAGLLPAATLYNAAVFRQLKNDTIDTTAELIISALDWLQDQGVHVINLSLSGPRNLLMETALQHLLRQGQLITAAAGNQGKTAAPSFPAAIDGVVAVTAVDSRFRVYEHANHGGYIDVAAPGVDIWAARPGKTGAFYSGTSFATPYASAALARLRFEKPAAKGQALIQELLSKSTELGSHGHDPVFGYGLVQFSGKCP